jgi:predicted GTPase
VEFEKKIRERAPMLKWVPILFTSALTGLRVQKVLGSCWKLRVSAGAASRHAR